MISSKPEGFKEGPGTGERLRSGPPSAELAEQFLQEREGQEQGSRQVPFCGRAREPRCPLPTTHRVRQVHPARQLRALLGWHYGKRKTSLLSAGHSACLLLGARPARSPEHIPVSLDVGP